MFAISRKTWAITSFLSLVFSAQTALAAPTISSVDTSQLSQGLITIKGSGFGGAPRVDIYEDFEHSGAKHGNAVDTGQTIIGNWTPHNGAQPTYDDIAMSGNFSADMWNNSATRPGRLTLNFQSPVQSVYMSYWVKIPAGYPFPGNDSSYQGFYSSDSSWKFTWLIDQDSQGNSSDLCVPTYSGSGTVGVGGNDGHLEYLPKIDNWWSKGNWMRITAWLEADPNAPTTKGHFRVQIWSAQHGMYELDRSRPVFDADGPTTKQYRYINFPGWMRDFPGNNGRPLYDDIYVSSGANAYARIELTDSTDYNKSTKFAIQKPISWTDNQVTFQVVAANIPDVSKAVIHVFNGAGDTSATGTAIQGAGQLPPPVASSPPVAPVLQVSVSP